MTAAADDVSITQPALTRSLKALEDELGVKLFERLPSGMVPTAFGELLYQYAKRMHQDYRHALAEIDAMRGGASGLIQIGAGPIWIAHFLPLAIGRFRKRWPDVRFSVSQGTITTMLPALLSGAIDMFCGSLDFPDHPEIQQDELLPIQHVVMASKQHPLAARESVSAQDLAAFPWAYLKDDLIGRRRVASFFTGQGVDAPIISLESPSVGFVCEMLASGEFIACLAEPLLSSRIGNDLVALKVDRPIWDYTAGIAMRSQFRGSLAIDRFVEHLHMMFNVTRGS
ncbi:MAG: hypothetical protein ABS87_01390 [Sphingomonas sp. SCN 67-18]|nr:MAG: hypothetical protein ABS87_01390 [Sphingomonas sp. SCN 67-18]